MKLIAALSFVLLLFLMDLTGAVNNELIKRDICPHSLYDYICPEKFKIIKKNSYPSCYHVYSGPNQTAMEAARICGDLSAYLIDLISSMELQTEDYIFHPQIIYHRFWVMPVNEDKKYSITAGGLCPAVNRGPLAEIPCGEKARVVCERKPVHPANSTIRKPVISVIGRGHPSRLILYEGTRVTLGCSVNRVRRTRLELYVKDTRGRTWIFNRNNLTIFAEEGVCGINTIAYTEQGLKLTVKTVTCIADRASKKDCSLSMDSKSCSFHGPFSYYPGELGLQLSVQFHRSPNIVLDHKEFLAFCFSNQYDYKNFMFGTQRGSNIDLRGRSTTFSYSERYAKYTDGNPAAVLKLDMANQCFRGKQFDILCYDQEKFPDVFSLHTKCGSDSLVCTRIRVTVDNKPLVEVKGKQFRQDTYLYENTNVIITCSYIRRSELQPAIHLSDSPVYSRSFTGEDLDIKIEKVNCGVRTSATLELSLNRSMDLMKKFVTCSIGSAEFTPCADDNEDCFQKGPFEYLSTPKKVELKVNTDTSPNIVVSCTSFGFKTVWALTDLSNDKSLNVLSKHDRGVKIEEMEIPKEKAWISHLTVQTKSRNLTGKTVTLGCYTEKIYADKLECSEFYFWCNNIVLKIANGTADNEDGFTFMKMKMVVLASLLPLVLIFVCCVMFKLCPCRKKKQALPVTDVSSTVQAVTHGLEKL